MYDRDITITVSDRHHQDAKAFLNFLQRAAKKALGFIFGFVPAPREFQCFVPFKELEQFGLFLQKLMVDLGLYYYLCSGSNRREVEKSVVRPIFRELLETHFQFIDPSLLRRHLLEGVGRRMAGEFANVASQEGERLLHFLKPHVICCSSRHISVPILTPKGKTKNSASAKGLETGCHISQ